MMSKKFVEAALDPHDFLESDHKSLDPRSGLCFANHTYPGL